MGLLRLLRIGRPFELLLVLLELGRGLARGLILVMPVLLLLLLMILGRGREGLLMEVARGGIQRLAL